MTKNQQSDAFHARRAHNYIKAAVRELASIHRLSLTQAQVLRKLYDYEDVLWQINQSEYKEGVN